MSVQQYGILRRHGWLTGADLERAAARSAKVGDEADPISFEGTWLGTVSAGATSADVSGPAAGSPYADPPE